MATQQQQVTREQATHYYSYYESQSQQMMAAGNAPGAQAAQKQAEYYKKWVDYHNAHAAHAAHAQAAEQAKAQAAQVMANLTIEQKAALEHAKQVAQDAMTKLYKELTQLNDRITEAHKEDQARQTAAAQAPQQKQQLDTFDQQLKDYEQKLEAQSKGIQDRYSSSDEAEKSLPGLQKQIDELEAKLVPLEAARAKAELLAARAAGSAASLNRINPFSLVSGEMGVMELKRRYPLLQWPNSIRGIKVHWPPNPSIHPGAGLWLCKPEISKATADARTVIDEEKAKTLDDWMPVSPWAREPFLPATARHEGVAYAVRLVIVHVSSATEHPWKSFHMWGCKHLLSEVQQKQQNSGRPTSDLVPYGTFWDAAVDGGDPREHSTRVKVARRAAVTQMGMDLPCDMVHLWTLTQHTERGPMAVEYMMPVLSQLGVGSEKLTLAVLSRKEKVDRKAPAGSDEKPAEEERETVLLEPHVQCVHPEEFKGSFDMRVVGLVFEDRLLRYRFASQLRDALSKLPAQTAEESTGDPAPACKRRKVDPDPPVAPQGKCFKTVTKKVTKRETLRTDLHRLFHFYDEDMRGMRSMVDYDMLLSALLSLDGEWTLAEVNELLARAGVSPTVPLGAYRQLAAEQEEIVEWSSSAATNIDITLN